MITVRQFSQFVGNTATVQSITQMLENRRVPQTIILEGPVGSGRKTLAKLVAAGLLCKNAIPCGECNSCRKVLFTGHPDVTLILPEKNKAQIGVEQIRAVRSDAYVRPVEGVAKVFIVGGSMNDAAQNAFLKVLEEPPAGVYFILVCEHKGDLVETVLSRGTVFSLGTVDFEQAVPMLENQGISISPEEFAARGGLIGSVLQNKTRLAEAAELARQMATALASNSRSAFLIAAAGAAEDRGLHLPVLTALYALLHKALMETQGALAHPANEPCVSLLGRRFSRERLLTMANIVAAQQKKIRYNVNGNLFFTALCSELLPRT